VPATTPVPKEDVKPDTPEPSKARKSTEIVEIEPIERSDLAESSSYSSRIPERQRSVPTSPPRMSVAAALQELEPLWDRMLSETAELGLSSPERQRLVLLAWISEARETSEASGYVQPVTDRVANIARYITGLSKRWWPGSIQALQIETMPGELMDELELDRRPVSWGEVAEAAEEYLAEVIEQDTADGRDEYGWIDDAITLNPPPLDPESDLRELCGKVENLTGSIQDYPPKEVPEAILDPSQEDLDEFIEWGRLVRWLRGSVIDFETWGNLIGRLRWIAMQLPKRPRKMRELEIVLNPEFQPHASWAKLIGRDPNARKKKKEIKQLYGRLHDLMPDCGDEDLISWLQEALPVLEPQALVQAVEPVKELFLNLSVDDVTDQRGDRRRFRQAQLVLSDKPDRSAESDVQSDETLTVDDGDDGNETVQDASERLLELVRPHTEDQIAIFVSNRNDPDLEAMLKEGLGFAEIVWCEGGPRTVQSVTEKIADGKCDFVLAATGFQSHAVDGKLYSACKRASIPYIRVNKGRLIASARAIATTLHLNGHYPSPEMG